MLIIENILRWSSVFFSGVTAGLYLSYFPQQRSFNKKTLSFFLGITLSVFTGFLIVRGVHYERCPFGTVFEALSYTAWNILLMYMVLELLIKEKNFGCFIIPLISVMQIIAAIWLDRQPIDLEFFESPFFPMHVSFILMAYAFFLFSFISSILYFVQSYSLKAKNVNLLFSHLPDLESLDKIILYSAYLGVGLLAIGTAFGQIWTIQVQKQSTVNVKMLLTLLLGGVYVLQLILRKMFNWRGKRFVAFSAIGFIILVLTFAVGGHGN